MIIRRLRRSSKIERINKSVFRKRVLFCVKGNIDMTPDYPEDALEQLRFRYNIAAKVADMY